MKVGTVFYWEAYPYPIEGEEKRRWFVYLGEYSDNLDPHFGPAWIIAPTTTTQLHHYEPGGLRADFPRVYFRPEDGFGFTTECVLDLSDARLVISLDVFRKNIETQKIKVCGRISDKKLRLIYEKIRDSRGYSFILKEVIHDNLNRAGLTGLKRPRQRRR